MIADTYSDSDDESDINSDIDTAGYIVDCHTHVVSPDTSAYPQQAARGARMANGNWWSGRDASVEAMIEAMDLAGVDGAMLVQAVGPYGEDNRYLADALASPEIDRERFCGVAVVDPLLPEVDARVEHCGELGMRGLRVFHIATAAHRPEWLDGPPGDNLIEAATGAELCLSVCIQPNDLHRLETQLERRPELPVALDHAAFVDLGQPESDEARSLLAMSRFPNLSLKLSPTLMEMSTGEPTRLISAMIDHFGSERIMWGTDWPQHQAESYPALVAQTKAWFASFDEETQANILGNNTSRFYRW